MQVTAKPRNPVVLTYLALRKAVGFVALGLPFSLAIPVDLAKPRDRELDQRK
jgi:hypothetical protein